MDRLPGEVIISRLVRGCEDSASSTRERHHPHDPIRFHLWALRKCCAISGGNRFTNSPIRAVLGHYLPALPTGATAHPSVPGSTFDVARSFALLPAQTRLAGLSPRTCCFPDVTTANPGRHRPNNGRAAAAAPERRDDSSRVGLTVRVKARKAQATSAQPSATRSRYLDNCLQLIASLTVQSFIRFRFWVGSLSLAYHTAWPGRHLTASRTLPVARYECQGVLDGQRAPTLSCGR